MLVLIVEDEPGIVDNISFILEQHDMQCIHATTVAEARMRMQSYEVDFIVLDVGLPDEDGFSFCAAVRKESAIPILFLTARGHVNDRIAGMELGADDYMVKPFSPRELLVRVQAIARRAIHEEAPAHPFRIDEAKRSIYYHDQLLPLVRYEFDILQLLIQHPGRIYSRGDLMDAVWDEPGSSYDRTIDTHIKTIRAKLKVVCDEGAIETHRGLGYALKEQW